MGYSVYCKDQVIWFPSLAIGNYFLGNINLLENLLKIESGIASPLADSIEIDPKKLSIFADKILVYVEEANNTPLFAMISGITEIILALNAEVNNDIPEETEKNRHLIEGSKRVFYNISDYIYQ